MPRNLLIAKIKAGLYQIYKLMTTLEPYVVYDWRDETGTVRMVSVAILDKPETCRTFYGDHNPNLIAIIAEARKAANVTR